MKRYGLVERQFGGQSYENLEEVEDGAYVEAAPALAWRRYALALEALANPKTVNNVIDAAHEKLSAYAALVALGEVEKP